VGKSGARKNLPSVEKDQDREHLNKLNLQKSVGPHGWHPQVWREPADVIAKPLDYI